MEFCICTLGKSLFHFSHLGVLLESCMFHAWHLVHILYETLKFLFVLFNFAAEDWLKPSVVLEAFEARAIRMAITCAKNLSKAQSPEEGGSNFYLLKLHLFLDLKFSFHEMILLFHDYDILCCAQEI